MSIVLDEIKDPKLRQRVLKILRAGGGVEETRNHEVEQGSKNGTKTGGDLGAKPQTHSRIDDRPARRSRLLNKTEQRWCNVLEYGGYQVLKQAITLGLDPPFTSYRPDLAYFKGNSLTFVEVKGPHRFREKGIAKAALAAKTYPMFRFELAEWTGEGWKESLLSP